MIDYWPIIKKYRERKKMIDFWWNFAFVYITLILLTTLALLTTK